MVSVWLCFPHEFTHDVTGVKDMLSGAVVSLFWYGACLATVHVAWCYLCLSLRRIRTRVRTESCADRAVSVNDELRLGRDVMHGQRPC